MAVVGAVLLYSLPSRDVVRLVGTDMKRMDVGIRPWFWATGEAHTQALETRDVSFINAVRRNGAAYVYRNEDTSWGFPPYLKFDSGTLVSEAQALISTEKEPIWVVVKHYGWRFELLSMFPNALSVRRATGPDELLIPWFNIVFIAALAGLVIAVLAFLRHLRARHIDPVVANIGEGLDDASKAAGGLRSRWQRWLDTWKAKPKRRF
jgi:hypothetical protein